LTVHFDLGSGSDRDLTNLNAWNDGAANDFSHSSQTDWVGTTGATLYLTGVQLEVGSTATDFEYRSYGEELALCQRYYITTNGQHDGSYGKKASAGDGEPYCFNSTGMFPVEMRVAPTITASSGTLDQCSAFSVTANQQQYLTRVTSGSSPFRAYEQILTFDSEL